MAARLLTSCSSLVKVRSWHALPPHANVRICRDPRCHAHVRAFDAGRRPRRSAPNVLETK